jgi:hypothetical protein
MTAATRRTPWILWPFVAVWDLIAWIVRLVGRLLAVMLGSILMILGLLLSITVIGAILGVPIAALGFLLVMRGLF